METSKHRFFQFLGAEILADNKLIVIPLNDGFYLGVLSSRVHVVFALSRRAQLGPTPVYAKTDCFDPFPFPLCGEAEKERIRKLAEELDAHRKRVQSQHGLTLTGLYNVLEKLRAAGVRPSPAAATSELTTASESSSASRSSRAAAPEDGRTPSVFLTDKEKLIHDQGLVSVLKQLHDDLDAAVFAAYPVYYNAYVRGRYR